MQEGDDLLAQIMPDNSGRRTRQKETDIRVIVGNPPWSAKQESANDNAANQEYPGLDGRIEATAMQDTLESTNLNALLHDSYIRAIRWASDRIGTSGVIGFVTNAGWMDGNAMDGMRKVSRRGIFKPLCVPPAGESADSRRTLSAGGW